MLSHVRLCDPMGGNLPGSSVHRIFQARVLEWVAISFFRVSSLPRDQTQVSSFVGRRFTVWATREALGSKDRKKLWVLKQVSWVRQLFFLLIWELAKLLSQSYFQTSAIYLSLILVYGRIFLILYPFPGYTTFKCSEIR